MTKSVLIVDDAIFMRSILKKLVSKTEGFSVVGEASNGSEAIEKFKALKPDIVTLDIVMPIKDGIQTLRELLLLSPAAKVFMISAMGQEMLKDEALSLGAAGFIEKPFKEDEVVRTLRSIA
jgi:two-component system, chemotaxis family, chemotaxis protein CheY